MKGKTRSCSGFPVLLEFLPGRDKLEIFDNGIHLVAEDRVLRASDR